MSTRNKTKSHWAYERAEHHIAAIRWAYVFLLFAMAGFDALVADTFDFPFACYILIVGVILGLDMSKLFKLFKGK
jgi:hypothetical protein